MNNHEEITAKSRVARMINALTFALQNFETCQSYNDKARKALQGVHSVWLLGGYLYEAIHLVDDLSTQYGRTARFKRLDQFARSSRPYRELFAEFNLNPAFNMDWGGDTTRKEIATLGNSTLYHTPEALDEGAIYPGIFTLDIHYLQDKADSLVTEEQLNDLVRGGLSNYARQFIEAGIEFIGEKPGKNFSDPLYPENDFQPKPVAVGFAGRMPDPEITTLTPDGLAFIRSLGDDPECHNRVPICFGGDFDPDAG